MKTRSLGLVVILIGFLMLAYTGFSYFTTEKVVDIGPIQINKEKKHNVNWSPIIGGILIVGGIIITIRDKKM